MGGNVPVPQRRGATPPGHSCKGVLRSGEGRWARDLWDLEASLGGIQRLSLQLTNPSRNIRNGKQASSEGTASGMKRQEGEKLDHSQLEQHWGRSCRNRTLPVVVAPLGELHHHQPLAD